MSYASQAKLNFPPFFFLKRRISPFSLRLSSGGKAREGSGGDPGNLKQLMYEGAEERSGTRGEGRD